MISAINDISLTGTGAGGVATPNIDAIGREGVTFTNGYAGNATCAPSRAALMTGRYATRFGYEFTPTDTKVPGWFPTSLFRPDAMFARNIAHSESDWEHKPIFDEAAAARAGAPGCQGHAGIGNHHSRTVEDPRLSHHPPRQMASGRSQGHAARRPGLR